MIRKVVFLGAALLAFSAHALGAEPVPKVVMEYPHGAFLENIAARANGEHLIASYADRRILRMSENGPPTVWATLDWHPVGLLVIGEDLYVSVHRRSFLEGDGSVGLSALLALDESGAIKQIIPAPEAGFLNGIAALEDGRVVAADSLGGALWVFDLEASSVALWRKDEALAPAPNSGKLGANGVQVRRDWAYVSNTSRGAIYRTPLTAPESSAMQVWRRPGSVDDFVLLDDGGAILATHDEAVLRLRANGRVVPILAQGCDGCTAVALRGRGEERRLLVLTSGWLGDATRPPEPARILDLAYPESAR